MSYFISGEKEDWEVVIGLEVHAQVVSDSKLFSDASTEFGAKPNTQVSLVDSAMPGMLPVINKVCIEQAVRTGLGLNSKINLHSVFERKNYFYPDLPQGYQISQYLHPIVGEGIVTLEMSGEIREIGVERLHLEQDAGKSIHDQDPRNTLIDLNRAGVALMEIVSKPDLRSPQEAGAYMRKLRAIMRYLGTCDGNMEEGSLRCDANVSVRPKSASELRTRAEIKNINSVRFVEDAIEYEAKRQVDIYDSGGTVNQETRLYDSDKGETRSMRSKEEAHDYRYFPDPDLLPIDLSTEFVDEIRKGLPELPDAKKLRFVGEMGLSEGDAEILVSEKEIADYFEDLSVGRDPKLSANWVIHELFARLKRDDLNIDNSPVKADRLGRLLDLIEDKTITNQIATSVLETMWTSAEDPIAIVEKNGLQQITDTSEIDSAVEKVILENTDQVSQYKDGNEKVLGWLVGQVMKATQGKADAKSVNEILRKKMDSG